MSAILIITETRQSPRACTTNVTQRNVVLFENNVYYNSFFLFRNVKTTQNRHAIATGKWYR